LNAINRPDPEVIAALSEIGCDTICSTLDGLGIKRNNIVGPVARVPGTKICGPALTLQFLPLREDQLGNFALPGKTAEETKKEVEGEEQLEKTSALWAVLMEVQPGDVIAVDARGDMSTGVFGEMLMTYFKAQGGAGVVIDSCIRDSQPIFNELKVPVWSVGTTTGGASHGGMFPHSFNVPIACGGVLVNPGDIIMADGGGAIVIPPVAIPHLLEIGGARDYKEIFVRQKLSEGGKLNQYYPFNEQGQKEYEEWLKTQGDAGSGS